MEKDKKNIKLSLRVTEKEKQILEEAMHGLDLIHWFITSSET